ncbi:MAG: zinc-dependent alcohol dehydrogenase [Christensenellaceae bacterium]|jgi:2-desacetyl-2-hydroxyethyl bacteriochlorophyllide A dehydrogenase
MEDIRQDKTVELADAADRLGYRHAAMKFLRKGYRKKMKAAVYEREGVMTIQEIEKPGIRKADDIIVRVEACSVCGTDVHMLNVPPGYEATPNTVLGHELVGEIVEVGDGVKNFRAGDRIVVNPNEFCGICKYCRLNMPNQCENLIMLGIEINGGFAEYVRVSEKCAFKIPADMKKEIAAFAEPLACAVNGVQKACVRPEDSVVVIGAGPIGLLYIQMMKLAGASPIISIEPNATRREYALRCGADYAVDPTNEDAQAFVFEKTDGMGANVAFDVVGSQMTAGIDVVCKSGTVVLFGNNAKARPEVKQSEITYKEAKVMGSWLANATFPKAVELLASGKLDLEFLVTHTFPLDQTVEAIDVMRRGEGIEVLVIP